MPAAPIAKGPYYPHYYNQPIHPINKTNTTIAKSGVIIMCAVLVAAGYTVYENREQVKELMDRTRRKISLAMHSFAEEIMPSDIRQRQPMAYGGRPLDGPNRPNSRNRSRRNSADSITLRGDDEKAEGSSRDAYLADSALRYRPPYRGSAEPEPSSSLLSTGNAKSPFDDENRVLFDAAAESADQHIREKTSPGSDASSDTLSAPMSEKGFDLSHDAPPMIPAVLPTVIDQPPPLPPRPSHPQYQESSTTSVETLAGLSPAVLAPAVIAPPPPSSVEPEEEDTEESQTTFSTSQPYWAIQQWTEDVTGNGHADDDAAADVSSSEVEEEDDDEDHSAVQSVHSESETISVIGSDEGESEIDDRVEFVSDLASSIGDTDGWSEVGSQFSEAERM